MNTNTVNMNMRDLTPRELETAVGGTFNGNLYPTREYESAGINVVRHFIE